MFKTISIVIVVIIAAIVIYAATQPDSFRVERSITIQASPDKIFPHINDFHAWQAWSPWENLDPAMKRSLSGPESGRGAVYGWEGNNQVGVGRMEILESVPSSLILIQLDFLKPMEGHNKAEFTLTPEGSGTRVSWAMYGPNPLLARVFQVFCSMDRMVGGQFEQGLSNLKTFTEK